MATQNSWEGLCPDSMGRVVSKLDYLDAARVSCVCASWREAVKASRVLYQPLLVKIRYRLTAVSDKLSRRPRPQGTVYFNGTVFPMENYRGFDFVGSSRNMLVLQDGTSTEIVLLNPFSRKSFSFPSPSTLIKADHDRLTMSGLGKDRKFEITKAVVAVTSNTKKTDGEPNPILVMIYSSHQLWNRYEDKAIAYCHTGMSWVDLDASERYEDIAARENRLLFALSTSGMVTAWDFVHRSGSDAKPAKILSFVPSKVLPISLHALDLPYSYLVETPGGFLLVRTYRDPRVFKISFDVYKSCLGSGDEWEEVKNLGDDRALFLGNNESALVSSRDLPRGCDGNSIYFGDGNHTCVYNLANKKISQLCGQYSVENWGDGTSFWGLRPKNTLGFFVPNS